MPIYKHQSEYTVKSTFAGVVNESIYSEKGENAISNGVDKLNKSIFGDKSSTYFDVSVRQSSLPTVQDCNGDMIGDAGTRAGFVKNLTGLYEMSSYEASINYKNNDITYQAFMGIDHSIGAGMQFKNGDRISAAYTVGSGAELAYSTDSGITQTKTGVYYDQYRESAGVAGIFQTQASHNLSIGGAANVDTKGNWSASISTNIAKNNSNIKLNAGIQNDEGSKSGFIGAAITF